MKVRSKIKGLISWRVGLLYFLGLATACILYFLMGKFDGVEVLQTSIIFGSIIFVVGGFLGRKLWQYRWFKIATLVSIAEFNLLVLTNLENKFVSIAAVILIPLVLIYLAFDRSNPYWLRGLSFGVIIPFWPISIFIFIISADDGFGAILLSLFILIPAIIIGMIIGLISGIILGKKRYKF